MKRRRWKRRTSEQRVDFFVCYGTTVAHLVDRRTNGMTNVLIEDKKSPEPSNAVPPPSPGAPPSPPGSELAPRPTQMQMQMQNALALVKRHPLRVLATGAAAGALVEVEFGLGVLAGIGAAALLVTQTGPDVRRRLVRKARGLLRLARKHALEDTAAEPSRVEAARAEAPQAASAQLDTAAPSAP